MFIETIDLLRCPREHDETWLVAAFTTLRDRFVLDGTLGCPVCDAVYPIADGIADFSLSGQEATECGDTAAPDPDYALRLAAFLNLMSPGHTVVLEGAHAAHAAEVATITQCRVIAVTPLIRLDDTELTSTVCATGRIPLASASLAGVALTNAGLAGEAARVLRRGGRLVGPAEMILPPAFSELARDDTHVVAESKGPLVGLSRQ